MLAQKVFKLRTEGTLSSGSSAVIDVVRLPCLSCLVASAIGLEEAEKDPVEEQRETSGDGPLPSGDETPEVGEMERSTEEEQENDLLGVRDLEVSTSARCWSFWVSGSGECTDDGEDSSKGEAWSWKEKQREGEREGTGLL